MFNFKKKTQIKKRMSKADIRRKKAEETAPRFTIVSNGWKDEIAISAWYDTVRRERVVGICADHSTTDVDETAAPTIHYNCSADLRCIANALITAADWMDEDKPQFPKEQRNHD